MTALQQWWRIFWAFSLTLLVSSQPAMADILDLSLNNALSCTGQASGTAKTLFGNFGTGGVDAQLYACQSSSLGYISSFLCTVESTLGMVIATFFCQLAKVWVAPLAALVMLFMFVSGVAFITGIVRMNARDFSLVIFKIGLITTFALNTDIALQIAFKLFLGIINETVTIFADAFSAKGVSTDFASRDGSTTSTVDLLVNPPVPQGAVAMGCSLSVANGAGLIAFGVMLFFFLPLVIGIVIMAVVSISGFLARAAFGYLYALVMLTFLVAAMPIFVSFALFSNTKQLFTAWLAYIFSNVVQIMIVFAFLGFAAMFSWADFIKGLSSLLVTGKISIPVVGYFWEPEYCTICEPNMIIDQNTGLAEIAAVPNQCKGGPVSIFGISALADFIYFLIIKVAALYIIGSVMGELMKDVPEMSKLLGGSSPAMLISGTPRSGQADGTHAIKAPFLTNATTNLEAGMRDSFGLVGRRNRGEGMLGFFANRNGYKGSGWGKLGNDLRGGFSAMTHGRNTLNRDMIQALRRNQKFKETEAQKKVDGLKTKSDTLKSRVEDLRAKKEDLERQREGVRAAFEKKRKKHQETTDRVMGKLGSREQREQLEKQYGTMHSKENEALIKQAQRFEDAAKIEKSAQLRINGVERAIEILDNVPSGKSLTAEDLSEIHKILAGLSRVDSEIAAKLAISANQLALQSNSNFMTAAIRAKDFAGGLAGKKAVSAKEKDLLKKSLHNLKVLHAETAIDLRRHFEATQEKYIGATMERDRHKAEWLFEQMAEKQGGMTEAHISELDDELIRARTEVMIAKKQMDMHKYDLQKNQAELGSAQTSLVNQEKALKDAEAQQKAMRDELNSANYLRGRTAESRAYLRNKYGIESPDSGGGILDEIWDPDDQNRRFFGDKKQQLYGGKSKHSWMSMMHSADN